MEVFNLEQIGSRTWKIVENDRYGQYPFLYVIMGATKCILIDTGCGCADYRDFVRLHINRNNLPYLVICTHVHFDHVGCNYCFSAQNASNILGSHCLGILMGGNDKKFSQNYAINSLALAHNTKTRDFEVTQWLNDRDLIYLDDNNKIKSKSLEVIYTPGHTTDSISLYDHEDKRLFIGDTIYPFTAIHLDCIGSNVTQYVETLNKLIQFIESVKKEALQPPPQPQPELPPPVVATVAPSSTVELKPGEHPPEFKQKKIEEFATTMGGSRKEMEKQFNFEQLFSMCDWNVENAIEFYLNNSGEIGSIFPPVRPTSAPTAPSPAQQNQFKSNDIRISCGHVESDLPTENILQVKHLMTAVLEGHIPPSSMDGDYGEYSDGKFTIILPTKNIRR